MKKAFIITVCFSLLAACRKDANTDGLSGSFFSSEAAATDSVTHPAHIIFVWLENKGYNTIIGDTVNAPYINSLISKGTLFTSDYALTHPSYPNYVAFFSGNYNGIKSDKCIDTTALTTPNLYTKLRKVRKSFAWYSEDLPATGSTVCSSGYYRERHNPTTLFANVPAKANKRFADFPTDYNQLENVVCISPNLLHDMHDGSVKQGDNWIKNHLSRLVNWCRSHNSIFVVFFDESEIFTDNRLPVIAIGEKVKANFRHTTTYNHYSWTKTICIMFSAPSKWTSNVNNARLIKGCWKLP